MDSITSPKISVITVVYNAKDTIEETILSVVNQTYELFEYIIIDGCSTDGTIEIINKYREHIAVFLSEPDQGIYDAMNKGINKASGEYIYFLGADDCLTKKDILSIAAGNLERAVDVLSGKVWFVDDKIGYQKEYTNKFSLTDIKTGYCIPHQGVFVKKSYLEKHNFNKGYKSAADREMFYYLYLKAKARFSFIDDKIAFFAMDGTSANINVSLHEDWHIMGAYGFSYREKVKYCIHNYLMKYRRGILSYLGEKKIFQIFFYELKRQRGWVVHHCENEKCRWCKRG